MPRSGIKAGASRSAVVGESPSPAPDSLRKTLESVLASELAAELKTAPDEIDVRVAITRLGIDSLAAFAIAERVERATGLRIEVTHLLDGLTIADLARQLAGQAPRCDSHPPADLPLHTASDEYPLSRGQEALWYLHQLAPESAAYHIAHAARVRGALDMEALRAAFQVLVDRHPALRTTFADRLGRPVQCVQEHATVSFQVIDARRWGTARFDRRMGEIAFRPFDLRRGPLLRVCVFRRRRDEHVLLVAMHHIVADLWSLAALVRELGALYEQARGSDGAHQRLPRRHYGNYVRWQADLLSGPEGTRLWTYWQRALDRLPPALDLPTDRPRPAVQSFRGATHTLRLDRDLTAQVRALSRLRGTTLFMTVLAAFQTLLHRYTGQQEILVGSPTAGRTRSEWAEIIGYFINPIVLGADFSGDPSFETVLARVRQTTLDGLSHADYPFSLLVEKLRPARDPSRSPLFQVLFNMPNPAALGAAGLAGFALGHADARLHVGTLTFESYPLPTQTAQLDLSLAVAEADGELLSAWQYNTDLFDAPTIARMAENFRILLESIVAHPESPVSRLPLLSADERQRVLVDWNDTQRPLTARRCVHQLVEEQVERTPHAPAIMWRGQTVSYRDLDQRANRIARRLQALGMRPESPVALYLERSPDMLIGLLAVLKAGGAYLPLDPGHPRERLGRMLDDARPPVILTQASLASSLPVVAATVVTLDDDWPTIPRRDAHPPPCEVIPEHLAYVIYTSGSTGRPKGVMNTHRAVANYLHWLQDTYRLTATDRVLQITPLTFDISVTECFWPLIAGAAVVLASPEASQDPAVLRALVAEAAITVLQFVPPRLRMFLEGSSLAECESVRLVLCGGEELPRDLNDLYHSRLRAEFHNLYGPTEASVWATSWRSRPGGVNGVIPIGRPMHNVRTYILDVGQQPTPIGVPGELHIGGEGLARGYLGQPALTADRFIPDPFSPNPHDRLYRTGDLARYLPDGNIEFLGRLDHQVKVRGYRVELGEIETAVARHLAVRECVVVARGEGSTGKRLVAYVVPRTERPPGADELRAFLHDKLPEYMLPAAFVFLRALPITANGKVDRAALPDPGCARPEGSVPFAAPRTADEDRLCELWGQVLNLDLVGIDDDFFELGGDSLRATELAARVSAAMDREATVRFIVTTRTVARAAAALGDLDRPNARPRPTRRRSRTGAAAHAGQPAAGTRIISPSIEISRRPLLPLLATGAIPPADAAAIAYLPTGIAEYTDATRAEILETWCEGAPVVAAVCDTGLGRIATLILPRFADQLYTDTNGLLRDLTGALLLAGRVGARTVSLTGLLPSATRYGHDLAEAVRGLDVPRLTTGHATTAAAVVLAIRQVLAATRRDIARERVAFLGLGSIGAAALFTMVDALPHPAEIFLCDVLARREQLTAIRTALVECHGYGGTVRVLESRAEPPSDLYARATLVVGATNVPDVIDIDRVQPGTIIVDDSAPHCFDPRRAAARVRAQGDILCTEGGTLRAPTPLPQLRYVPPALANTFDLATLAAFEPIDPNEIMGCVFSSVLSARIAHLAPTIGLVDGPACLQHFRALEDLGFGAGMLRCDGTVVDDAIRRAFAARFGGTRE